MTKLIFFLGHARTLTIQKVFLVLREDKTGLFFQYIFPQIFHSFFKQFVLLKFRIYGFDFIYWNFHFLYFLSDLVLKMFFLEKAICLAQTWKLQIFSFNGIFS
eukprot:TRINITY_DN1113_c0_g3_i1.p3 TRINITY_DN1113_c0_g3~~TRINITY_DN1113_c0_g3_i1.p3  ORF type:complete len:103 (-),score=2.86 TRINITY_DN1113_c0_g3_i1:374-682(-)